MRLGLFGGAFDPPHLAHHRIAQAAIHTYALDRLYIVPTGDAWHKSRSLSPGQHRLAMARLAFADLPQAWIEPMEVEREGPSYTIDTLRALQARHPQATWYLFIGGDQARAFGSWRDAAQLAQMAQLVVAQRPQPGEELSCHNLPVTVQTLPTPVLPVSATELRAHLARQMSTQNCLSSDVLQYIHQHHLYRSHD